MSHSLLLASASPRRRELLAQIGVRAETLAVNIEEIPAPHETPAEYVVRVAREKAVAAAEIAGSGRPILAADTEVVLDGDVFGKPRDYGDFCRMMTRLSNREHQVLSAVVLLWNDRSWSSLCESRVRFASLTDTDIANYWHTGEPIGKAGGYAIQGYGALFVSHLSGSYSSVMGLPLHETAQLLVQAGIPVLPSHRTL
jgi:septum formation protein